MIRVTSRQTDEEGRTEEIVLDSPGVYGEDEEGRYISYDETSLVGMEGTRTTLRMYGGRVRLTRAGAFVQETEYIEGEETHSDYMTPMGQAELIQTSREVEDFVYGGNGRLRLVYEIEMVGLFCHVNEIIIEVKER